MILKDVIGEGNRKNIRLCIWGHIQNIIFLAFQNWHWDRNVTFFQNGKKFYFKQKNGAIKYNLHIKIYKYEIRKMFVNIKFQNDDASLRETKKVLSCVLNGFPQNYRKVYMGYWSLRILLNISSNIHSWRRWKT